ncbi:CehA/McbA family metallohydrolase [Halomicrobium katesii]|uniref:CehA/McbA family metallohydrolase n=1 Tax=Halomicrobium katesii TaxID=437163 RepID=UPI000370D96D|nr:CehA/McbA family metallohydrolase [Halomicrobium katesii]
MQIEHPYTGDGRWLRGNLHTHTTETDGADSVEDVLDAYESIGHDFLAISDHDLLVDPDRYRADTSLTLLPAVEVTANGSHVVHVGATAVVEPRADRQTVVDDIREQGAMAIPAHPNWEADFDHWPQRRLSELTGYHGIEIYNGNIERCPGTPLATDRWDQLLSAGRRVWGFGTDDAHDAVDIGNAWTVVQVAERTPAAVLEALTAGQTYVSTGVGIERIAVEDGSIELDASERVTARLVSDWGRVQRTRAGETVRFHLPDDLVYGREHSYVRVECRGRGDDAAWTQPFYLA